MKLSVYFLRRTIENARYCKARASESFLQIASMFTAVFTIDRTSGPPLSA